MCVGADGAVIMRRLEKAVLIIVFICLFSFISKAESLAEILPGEILDALPENALSALEAVDEEGEASPDAEAVAASLSANEVYGGIKAAFSEAFPPAIKCFCGLFGLVVLSSCAGAVRDGCENSALKEALGLVSSLCIVLGAFGAVNAVWVLLENTLGLITVMMSAMLPVMTGLMISSGQITSSALAGASLAVVLNILEKVCTGLLSPLFKVCTSLTLISACTSDGGDISSLNAFLRNSFSVICGGVMTVLCAVMTYQTSISAGADSLLLRTVKFAVSGMIPVVGSSVGDAASNAFSSFAYIKSTAGAVSSAALLLTVLYPMAAILCYRLALGIASGAAGLLGCQREGGILRDLGGLCGFALALLSMVTLMFIFTLTLMSRSASGV